MKKYSILCLFAFLPLWAKNPPVRKPRINVIVPAIIAVPNFINDLSAVLIEASNAGINFTGGSSTVNAVARFADTNGSIKNSSVLVDDAGNIQINGITKNSNTVSWPTIVGAAGSFLGSDGAGNLIYATPFGGGNVSTASAFTSNNAILTVDLPSGCKTLNKQIF